MDLGLYEEVGSLIYIESGADLESKYPQLLDGEPAKFTIQAGDNVYDLYICINYASERLYYKVKDLDSDSFIIRYNILIEGMNLTFGVIDDYELVFYKNTIYQRQL